jgi:hypothetical protein
MADGGPFHHKMQSRTNYCFLKIALDAESACLYDNSTTE